MKKITVILPLYELSSDVKRAVLSVKHQSLFSDVELIIVDLRKFGIPKNYDKNKNGNVPAYVKTDKKIAKIKSIDDYLKSTECVYKIIVSEEDSPYLSLNRAIDESIGEYVIFLQQNSVLTKNILEILYTRCLENKADILIGNLIKQRGKKIKISNALNDVYKNDECKNFAEIPNVLLDDFSLYNKMFKATVLKSSKAYFPKYNAPRNIEFLSKAFANSNDIFVINREISLCDFKRLYEYEFTHDIQYNLAYADSLLKIIDFSSKFNDEKYIKSLINHYVIPLFDGAQKSVNSQLRGKCVEIYNSLNKTYSGNKPVKKLGEKYPVAKQKNYKRFRVILSKVKHKITH